jgi:hypothetical protein
LLGWGIDPYVGKKIPEEIKNKIGLALRGRSKPPRTENHNKNASEAMKKWWEKKKNEINIL